MKYYQTEIWLHKDMKFSLIEYIHVEDIIFKCSSIIQIRL